MKLKPGDQCEIVDGDGFTSLREYIGRECTIQFEYPHREWTGRPELMSWVVSLDGKLLGFYEHCLRLKRPPSWDSWITDTRDVERENREQVPA